MDLDFLIPHLDAGPLVPECYIRYRRFVSEAVQFFVRSLSEPRRQTLLAEQLALPMDTDLAHRVVRLIHHCPALHKMGQVLARRRELDPHLRRRLQQLESLEPRTPVAEIAPILQRELAESAHAWTIRPGRRALAEGSVAVVVPAIATPRRHPRSTQRVVLKILKPGITATLEEDLDILGRLAGFLDERADEYHLPPIDYRGTFDQVRTLLTHEVRLGQEQHRLVRARRFYAGRPEVVVPQVLPFSTPHLTAMQRLDGVKITDRPHHSRHGRPRLAESIVRVLVAGVLFSREPRVPFHGDPHAGNLLALDDGRLGLLDWSLSGELTLADRNELVQALVGGFSLDRRHVARSIAAVAEGGAAESRLLALADAALAEIQAGALPAVDWLMRLLDGAAHAGVRFRSDLMLFRKAYFTLEGVVHDLCPGCSMQQLLLASAAEALAGEWPWRWVTPAWSRDFNTHLSNADLTRIAAALPWRLARWWQVHTLAFLPAVQYRS